MEITIAVLAILVTLWGLAKLRRVLSARRNRVVIPKESLRSLIIEGVVKVNVKRVDWDNYNVEVCSPIPIFHYRNNENYLVISYLDGTSPVVLNDKNLGDLSLLVAWLSLKNC